VITKAGKHSPKGSGGRQPFEVFQQAIHQHQFISEYIANAQRATAALNERRGARKLARLKSFLTQNVVEHFRFEEEAVFPQLQTPDQTAATRQVVAELLSEHKPLLAAARKLHRRLDHAVADARGWPRLEQALHKFLKTLQEHALKEDNIFLAEKYAHRPTLAATPARKSLAATVGMR
jgi:iron-sulfur cluster repair protein YtfE (RIC family)